MKKSVIALWIVAALFLVSAFPMFAEGNVGAGISGIAIAAVLAFIGYMKNKKGKQAAEAPAPAPADDLPYEFLKTKIAGVTFKNGRKTRQAILRRLYWKDAPFDKNAAEVALDRGEYEGKPAFAVLLNGEVVGYVPAEHAEFLEANFDRCDGVTRIEAYCGKDDIYGAEITIRFRKV